MRVTDVVLRLALGGSRRFRLRATRRSRAALGRPGSFRVILTARFRPPGGPTLVRRVVRRVRR